MLYPRKTTPSPHPNGWAMGCILWVFVRNLTVLYWHCTLFSIQLNSVCCYYIGSRSRLWLRSPSLDDITQWRYHSLTVGLQIAIVSANGVMCDLRLLPWQPYNTDMEGGIFLWSNQGCFLEIMSESSVLLLRQYLMICGDCRYLTHCCLGDHMVS